MALPLPTPDRVSSANTLPPVDEERPPRGGWYWNSAVLARTWLPLIGIEGIGLLDLYLAFADYRPHSQHRGWAAVTLTELTRLTGWGRARLIRLNRTLAAAGLLTIAQLPVDGRGPCARRSLYRVVRSRPLPDPAAIERLTTLATADLLLATRLERWRQGISPVDSPPPLSTDSQTDEAPPLVEPLAPPAPAPTSGRELATELGPVSQQYSSIEVLPDQNQTTTKADGDEQEKAALRCWHEANQRLASPLEHQRLTQLANRAAANVQATPSVGWTWVQAAITEAVEAGSQFVAPRRIERIIDRWQAEGVDPTTTRPAAARRQQDTHHARLHPRTQPPLRRGRQPQPKIAPHHPETCHKNITRCENLLEGERTPERQQTITPIASLSGSQLSLTQTLHSALALADLTRETFLQRAAIAGRTPQGEIVVTTPTPIPEATARRLTTRLSTGLTRISGHPVRCVLWASYQSAAGQPGGNVSEYDAREGGCPTT